MLRSDTYYIKVGKIHLLASCDSNQPIWFCFPCGDALCVECAQSVVDSGTVDDPICEFDWFLPAYEEEPPTCTGCGKEYAWTTHP